MACCDGKENVAPFELIPWLLGQCATVADAKKLLARINILKENFSFRGRIGNILENISRGMGALGLPGDASSMSRFVKATFVKMNARSGDSEEESVSQFLHILRSVDMHRENLQGSELIAYPLKKDLEIAYQN